MRALLSSGDSSLISVPPAPECACTSRRRSIWQPTRREERCAYLKSVCIFFGEDTPTACNLLVAASFVVLAGSLLLGIVEGGLRLLPGQAFDGNTYISAPAFIAIALREAALAALWFFSDSWQHVSKVAHYAPRWKQSEHDHMVFNIYLFSKMNLRRLQCFLRQPPAIGPCSTRCQQVPPLRQRLQQA